MQTEQFDVIERNDYEPFESMCFASASVEPLRTKAGSSGKEADPGRFFKGVLNANRIDRHGERFDPMGVDAKAYKRVGGPVMVEHFSEVTRDGFSGVVARVHNLSNTQQGVIITKAEFDTDPISEHWMGKVHRGYVRGLSAGLMRIQSEIRVSKKDDTRHIVVTKSELIHAILTSQPVSRESLIAAKSIGRLSKLESEIETLRGRMPSEDQSESLQRLSDQLAELSAQFKSFCEAGRPSESNTDRKSLDSIADSIAGLCTDAMKLASHPELPDAAFIIEKGAERDSSGRVVRKFRHLPHHTSAVKSPSDNTSINKALLRNALARVNQVQPAKEAAESYRKRAESHLRRHASALGIGTDRKD